jgi:hypothetical protein
MAALDILSNPVFSPIALTRAMRVMPYVPGFLGSLNLFGVDRIRDTRVALRRINGKVTLIPTTERGGDPVIGSDETGDEVYLKTPRLAKRQRKQAHALQNLRSLDGTNELMTVQDEITRIQANQRQDLELTMEYHRMGAITGRLLDADGTRVLANFYSLFGISEPALIDMRLDEPDADIRGIVTGIVRTMRTQGKGAVTIQSRIIALCGDNFWDALIGHKQVVETYRAQEGARLREGVAYGTLDFGGVTWVNYRGTDDGTTVSINTDQARFFPTNAPDVFGVAFSPFEGEDFVNTPGEDVYSIVVRDMERGFWFQPEIYSYPLHYCRMPELLLRAKKF